jgi:hypothetical protein
VPEGCLGRRCLKCLQFRGCLECEQRAGDEHGKDRVTVTAVERVRL